MITNKKNSGFGKKPLFDYFILTLVSRSDSRARHAG